MPPDPPTTMDGDPLDMSRRDFMLAGTTSLVAMDTGTFQLSGSEPVDEYEFQGAADLMGPADARPQPGSEFFDNKVFYAYRYTATDTGEVAEITQDDSDWRQLATALKLYENETLPASPPTGQLVFDEDRGVPAWWDRDHWEWPNFVDNQDVLINTVEVAGTTQRTTIYDPGLNPDSLIAGRTYQVDLMGDFSTANTSSMFTIYANLAGAQLAGITNAGANVTDAPWSVEFTFTIRADGQNGELVAHTRGLFDSQPADSDGGPETVDTTTGTQLSFDVEWNDGSAGNAVRLEQAHVKQQG